MGMFGLFGDKDETELTDEERQEQEVQKRGWFDSLEEGIADKIEEYEQERVGIQKNHQFHYPLELKSGDTSKAPFIRFKLKNKDNTKNISMYLYQPPGFSVADGVNYTAFNVGTIRGGIGLATQIASGDGMSSADMAALAMMSKDKIFSPNATIDKITGGTALKLGVASNPYTRTAYDSTNVRNFQFDFKMIAENKDESQMILSIERTFRKFLYPKRAGSVALIYPPLFEVSFYAEGKLNKYMPTIKASYLTNVETTYNETSVAMHKTTGAPLEVNLSLQFQEERVLVRQDLYKNDASVLEQKEFHTPAAESFVKT